jgi:hypothetical protein
MFALMDNIQTIPTVSVSHAYRPALIVSIRQLASLAQQATIY